MPRDPGHWGPDRGRHGNGAAPRGGWAEAGFTCKEPKLDSALTNLPFPAANGLGQMRGPGTGADQELGSGIRLLVRRSGLEIREHGRKGAEGGRI